MGNKVSSNMNTQELLDQLEAKWKKFEEEQTDEALQEAIDFGTQIANKGNAEIQFLLAVKLEELGGLEDDALRWYKKAAKQGHTAAMYAIGDIIRAADQDDKAFKFYSKAAAKGYPPAMYKVGYMLHHGLGVKKDLVASFNWYKKAVEAEENKETKGFTYIPCLNNLARCYNHGFGTEPNGELAMKYYKAASDLGDAIATHNIGITFQKGQNRAVDLQEAVKWFKKGASLGFPESFFELAIMYLEGQGVKENRVKSVVYMVQAAERQQAEALSIILEHREMLQKQIEVRLLGQETNLVLMEMGETCDPKKLEELETKIKGKLPRDYRIFLQKYNGGLTLYSGVILDRENMVVDNGVEHYFDIDEMLQLNPYPGISRNAVVFGEDASNNVHYIYFKGPKRGQVYFYDADEATTQKNDVFPAVANSFLAFTQKVCLLDLIMVGAFRSGYGQIVQNIKLEDIEDEKEIREETIEEGGVPEEGDESEDADKFAKIIAHPIEEARQNPELNAKLEELLKNKEDLGQEIERMERPPQASQAEKDEGGGEEEEVQAAPGGRGPAVLRLPFLGFVAPGRGYVRTKDCLLADNVLSMIWGMPIGPIFRHKKKLMWDYGVYNKVTKRGGMKGIFSLVPKDIGSVVWGKLPRICGSHNFVEAVKNGTIENDMSNYKIPVIK